MKQVLYHQALISGYRKVLIHSCFNMVIPSIVWSRVQTTMKVCVWSIQIFVTDHRKKDEYVMVSYQSRIQYHLSTGG